MPLWDVRKGRPIGQPLTGHTEAVKAVTLGEIDGRAVVVSGSRDCTIRLWDARTGELIGKPLEGHADVVKSVALGAINGRAIVVSASTDGSVRLWDSQTQQEWASINLGFQLDTFAFNPDIGLIFTVLSSGLLAIELRQLGDETIRNNRA